ncbi:hypothetical protein [Sphingobium abikonense]|uniref:hypothetical protein n=1 Tax=Sphingobium abikonense TaxID=86193 RepID=UPI003518C293
MTDLETLAKGLTAEQREAVLKAEYNDKVGRWFARFISIHAGKGLVCHGLATAVWSGAMLSSTGEALRTYLMENPQ